MDDSPKRFDRIVAILIQLQSKKIVRAQDLADRFEVSLRTIYRDIRTLEASGVPIYSEAGIGYSLLEGYRLPPVMFTREEAGSFIAAEKLMQKFTDKELGKHYASAAFKLKAVLRSTDKEWISNIESNVLMQPAERLFHEQAPNSLSILFKAIAEKTQVYLLYMPAEAAEPMERVVEPVGIFHENNNWYTFAYCHLRNDYRQFRADRIHSIRVTDRPFTLQHQPLEVYLQNDKEKIPTTRVRILVDKKIAKHLEHEKKYHGFVSEKLTGDQIEMTFLTHHIENGFSRWFMMFGDCAKILEPESLKDSVLELMEKIYAKINPLASINNYLSQK
ncbi:helix-turn-helix transcriptional regulator [Pedobacter deserti]|uniref:helix-turn-helix transcriptional regulator n=1 Tax=Pedobacter deserti TaxID=2817382 RepID=UPI00210AEDE3|nr:YafY family protein [Pedobacter sp. SYSU D00382]